MVRMVQASWSRLLWASHHHDQNVMIVSEILWQTSDIIFAINDMWNSAYYIAVMTDIIGQLMQIQLRLHLSLGHSRDGAKGFVGSTRAPS
ncbi:hypothetical protein Hdeb2414_s0001g00006201 [Helianthus debilis subsp. tardiflorus]